MTFVIAQGQRHFGQTPTFVLLQVKQEMLWWSWNGLRKVKKALQLDYFTLNYIFVAMNKHKKRKPHCGVNFKWRGLALVPQKRAFLNIPSIGRLVIVIVHIQSHIHSIMNVYIYNFANHLRE